MSTRRTDKRFVVEVSPALYEELNRVIPDRLRRRVVTPLLQGLVKVLQKEENRSAIIGAILNNEMTTEQLLEMQLQQQSVCPHQSLVVIGHSDGLVIPPNTTTVAAAVCAVCRLRINLHIQVTPK